MLLFVVPSSFVVVEVDLDDDLDHEEEEVEKEEGDNVDHRCNVDD